MYIAKEPLITFRFEDNIDPRGSAFVYMFPIRLYDKSANMELYVREDNHTGFMYPDMVNYNKRMYTKFINVDKDKIIFMDAITKKYYSSDMLPIVYQIARKIGKDYSIVNPDMTMEQMKDRYDIEVIYTRDANILYGLDGINMYQNKEYQLNLFDIYPESICKQDERYSYFLVDWDDSSLEEESEIMLYVEKADHFTGEREVYASNIPLYLRKVSDNVWIPSSDNISILTRLDNVESVQQYKKLLESTVKKITTQSKI